MIKVVYYLTTTKTKEGTRMFKFYLLPQQLEVYTQQGLVMLVHNTLGWEIGSFDVMKVIYSDKSWAYFLDVPTCLETDYEIDREVDKLIGAACTQ